MKRERDVAGVLAPPPLIFGMAFALGLWLDAKSPLAWPWAEHRLLVIVAVVAGAMAIGIAGWQFSSFGRAGTPVSVWHPTRTLVTDGPYRFSRNPVYVAMVLLYLAAACAFGRWWTLFALIPAVATIRYGVIRREEIYLRRKFGDAYIAYAARVRRWL